LHHKKCELIPGQYGVGDLYWCSINNLRIDPTPWEVILNADGYMFYSEKNIFKLMLLYIMLSLFLHQLDMKRSHLINTICDCG
jgi:hypothetical protein